SQAKFAVEGAIDGKPATAWAILPQAGRANEAIFETAADVGQADETTITFRLVQNFGTSHTLGHLRLSATTAPRPVRVGGGLPANVTQILAVEPATRSPDQQK